MVRRTVGLEVVRFGMCNRMSAIELTQVSDNFRGAMFWINADYGGREIWITVRAPATRDQCIELAVQENNVCSAKCVT
jgi:hypothetical protein